MRDSVLLEIKVSDEQLVSCPIQWIFGPNSSTVLAYRLKRLYPDRYKQLLEEYKSSPEYRG